MTEDPDDPARPAKSRKRRYRERLREAGYHQVAVWLDGDAYALLCRLMELQQLDAAAAISAALTHHHGVVGDKLYVAAAKTLFTTTVSSHVPHDDAVVPRDTFSASDSVPRDTSTVPKDVPRDAALVSRDALTVLGDTTSVPSPLAAPPRDAAKDTANVPRDVAAVPSHTAAVPRNGTGDVPSDAAVVPRGVPRDGAAVPSHAAVVPRDASATARRYLPHDLEDRILALRECGLSLREVARKLAEEGCLNSKGRPYSSSTIVGAADRAKARRQPSDSAPRE